MAAYTYIVRCENGALYTGITRDVRARLATHASQKEACAKFTRSFRVIELVALFAADTYSLAARLEYAIKRLPKKEKEALIAEQETALSERFPHLPCDAIERVEDLAEYMDIFDK